jgi:hypothetical protein
VVCSPEWRSDVTGRRLLNGQGVGFGGIAGVDVAGQS